MPGFESLKQKLSNNKILIIIILILLLLLYLVSTSKTQGNNKLLSKVNNEQKQDNVVKEQMTNQNKKAEFTVYYTTWCGWSKKALAMLQTPDIVNYFNNNPKCSLVLIDCEKDNGPQICKANNIQGFPTMKLIMGDKILDYNGKREPKDIIEFVNRNTN